MRCETLGKARDEGMINRFQHDKSTLRGSICTEAAASYRRVIGVFSTVQLARVSSGVTLEGGDAGREKGWMARGRKRRQI